MSATSRCCLTWSVQSITINTTSHLKGLFVKLVAYLRVSTDKQAEQGLGLEVQEQAIRKWARANGHRITLWTSDEGISGSNGLDTRIGLAEALAAVRDGEVGALVVYRLDRLARDLTLQESLLAEIRRTGGDLFSTSNAEAEFLVDDPDDPSRKMIRQVLGAVNEFERSMIALRLRSGRARKAEKGGFAYGSPPFGYRAENGELIPVPEEFDTVARIRALHAEGRSLREIGSALEAEGRTTKRGGTRWHPTTVQSVLRHAAAA